MAFGPQPESNVYHRVGRAQEAQRFYEDAAPERLAELAGIGYG